MFLEGRAVAEEALRIAEAVAHHTSLMIAYRALGLLALRQGDTGALVLLERAVTICQDADLPVYFPWMAATLGAAYTLARRVDDAVPLLTRALKQTTAMERDALGRLGLAEAHLLDGRLEEARVLAELTLALANDRGERGNQAYALRLLGEIAAHQQPSEPRQALQYYQQALALSDELAMRPLAAHCHLGLSRVYRRADRPAEAHEHLTTAITTYVEMGMRFSLEPDEAAVDCPERR
jgi:tetratricopeptide (TPR) repeat protein